MKPTDVSNPEYFHKVVDCQYACPSHTPVPEYIRLIAAGRYTDAYMVNWESNVFPGILGRMPNHQRERTLFHYSFLLLHQQELRLLYNHQVMLK